MRIKKTKATPDLSELRERYRKIKEDGELQISKYISHMKKLEEYYSDWENRLNAIQKEINKLEDEHGIGAEQILSYDLSEDLASLQ